MKILVMLSFLLSLGCASGPSARDQQQAEAHQNLAMSLVSRGQLPEALGQLLEAEKLDPRNPQIQYQLGLTYASRDRLDLSEKHLRQALRWKQNFTEARNALARVLNQQEKFEEALVEANKVVKDLTYPHPDRAWVTLGMVYFNQGETQAAREAFSRSIQINRNNCEANAWYGRSLFEDRRYRDSAQALDLAAEMCRSEGPEEALYFGALSYFRMGDTSTAISRLERLEREAQGHYRMRAQSLLGTLRSRVR